MKCIILIQLSGCTAKSPFTKPLKESIHPEMAVPRPPPIFTPNDILSLCHMLLLFSAPNLSLVPFFLIGLL